MTLPYPYVICVSDGHVMRTLHRPAFSPEDAATIDTILGRTLASAPKAADKVVAQRTMQTTTMVSADEARRLAQARGFTGDSCDTCGSFEMVRNGTCLLCKSCGATTGCS